MGQIHINVELINPEDAGLARRLMIDPEEIRRMTVNALVDTGALMMAINENIQEFLQLPIVYYKHMQLANGKIVECPVVGPLTVRCMDETAGCNAVVMPGDSQPLLGAIPLEEMNLIIDSQRQELIPNSRFIHMRGFRVL